MCLDVSSRKPLPNVETGVHVDNELDRNIRSYRISVMGDIVRRAGELKKQMKKEANIKESLNEIKNYLAMLKNLTVEVESLTLFELSLVW